MFLVRKKVRQKLAKTNQVICNSRSFKVTNIRPARKSAELVRRQHAWGAIACYPRRRRPNSAFSAIAVAADCSDRADSNRTLWGAALGHLGIFIQRWVASYSLHWFFLYICPRPTRSVQGDVQSTSWVSQLIERARLTLKAMEFCVWPSTAIHFPFIFRHDQFWQDIILGWMVWIRQCVWVLPGLTL